MPNFNDAIAWLMQLPPEGLVFVFCVIVGYGIRRLDQLPNKLISPVCIVLAVAAYFCMAAGDPAHAQSYNIARKLIVGLIIGFAGALFAVALHNQAATALAKKWPAFSFLVCDDTPENPTINPVETKETPKS